MKPNRRIFTLLAAIALLPFASLQPVTADTVLKGTVTQSQQLQMQNAPALSRFDMEGSPDPFNSGENMAPIEAFDAPAGAFKTMQEAPPFKLGTGTQGPGRYDMPLEGMPAQVQQQPPMQPQAQFPRDPDSQPELQLAWDAWHRRVAEEIYRRFNFFAKAAFKRSPPMLVQVSYVVTVDGRITQMNMVQKSPNVLFNVLVFQTIKSLDGDRALLQFPPGSRRQFVEKWGTFAQNYGADGFKYTVGDKERLTQR